LDASVWVHFLRKKGDSIIKGKVAALLHSAEAVIRGNIPPAALSFSKEINPEGGIGDS
jgi:hypothetical protein